MKFNRDKKVLKNSNLKSEVQVGVHLANKDKKQERLYTFTDGKMPFNYVNKDLHFSFMNNDQIVEDEDNNKDIKDNKDLTNEPGTQILDNDAILSNDNVNDVNGNPIESELSEQEELKSMHSYTNTHITHSSRRTERSKSIETRDRLKSLMKRSKSMHS